MNCKYAFIVHSRDRSDMSRKYPWIKYLPNFIIDFITFNLRPIIVSSIHGLIDNCKRSQDGIIIGVPMTARQLVEHRDLARTRIIQAVELAKTKGVVYVGLGAMTASLTRGGLDVIDNVTDVTVTTGRTYTIKNIVDYFNYCILRFNLDPERVRVAIVGAAGGIGSGVALALALKNIKHFVLIDVERKVETLRKHITTLGNYASDINIISTHQVSNVKNCDFIICATSAPEVIIKSDDVSPGTVIINDAQPSDVSPEIMKFRRDVLVIEGGVVFAPNILCNFDFGLAHKNDIFSCLAETLLLTYLDQQSHYSVGDFDLNLYNVLSESGLSLGFRISTLQNELGILSENHMNEFAKIKLRSIKA